MENNIFSKRRSIRLYKQGVISRDDMEFIINAARLAPSAMNLQPLKFIAVISEEAKEKIFPLLRWAGYVKPRRVPGEGQRPSAYIAVCSDGSISTSPYIPYDVGAAVYAIQLSAESRGIGSCWLGAIDKAGIHNALDVPKDLTVHCVVSLGVPAERPVIDDFSGDVRYFLDENNVLHVPKRKLQDVLDYR